MIEAMPSITKNAISTSVSDTVPLSGENKRTRPAAMPISAEINDHQNPGACLAQNVVNNPTTPLTRNIQPMMMVKASVANGGTKMAANPRMTRIIPSTKNSSPMLMDGAGEHAANRLHIASLRHGHGVTPFATSKMPSTSGTGTVAE